jgi:hypothetical protein
MTIEFFHTGFWIDIEEGIHYFSPELSKIINNYVSTNNIKTVYDLGCGNGEYLDSLVNKYPEISATGFEGFQIERLFKNVIIKDLSKPLQLDPADLVISIEVGEHLPKEFEQTFIDNISNNATNHLIISWAIEGQEGLGHVNCQNNDYIINQFEIRGWNFNAELSYDSRSVFPEDLWLKNTLMFFSK